MMNETIKLVNRLLDKVEYLEEVIFNRKIDWVNLKEERDELKIKLNKETDHSGNLRKENERLNRELIKMQEKIMEENSNE